MTTIDTLTARNTAFAAQQFAAGAPIMPSLQTMIISCVDPRVDPAHVLGLAFGEAVVIRTIGGRITPPTLHMLHTLQAIAQTAGAAPSGGFSLIVLHHTNCGITLLADRPALLTDYFGVAPHELAAKAVTDPYASVAVDVAVLKADSALPDLWTVAGLVYDVKTGLIETVVAPAPLRNGKDIA